MYNFLLCVHIIVVIALIGLVLMQNGKGADLSASLSGGNANTMLGNAGMVSFIVKLTAVLAALFFMTSIGLGVLTAQEVKKARSVAAMQVTATDGLAKHVSGSASGGK